MCATLYNLFLQIKKKTLIINRNSGDKIQMSNRYRQEFN